MDVSTSPRPGLSRLDRQARLAVIAAMIMGYAVLFAAGVYSVSYLPGVFLALALGYVRFYDSKSAIIPDVAWTGLTLLLVAGMMVLSFTGRIYFLDALNWIFLFLPLIKLLTAKAERDYLQLFALAFGQILYATIVNTDLSFGLVLAAYLAVSMWGLILLSFRSAARRRPEQPGLYEKIERIVFSRKYIGLVAVLPLLTLLLTFFLFFLIPRPGSGLAGINLMLGARQSGFSDRVELGEVGEIKINNAVALRIEVSGQPLQQPIYWRGAVLDAFDGMTWTARRFRPIRLPPNDYREGLFILSDAPPSSLTRQRVFLVSMDATYLVHSGFLHRARARASHILVHSNGSVTLPRGAGMTAESYEVWSHPRSSLDLLDRVLDSYLELPEGLDPRILELTRRITEGTRTPLEAARAIEEHLKRNYRYSLNARQRPSADPMGDFLFETRAGHCEFFASAMTLMLRQQGIHARYVAGFQQGEYNPIEGYFIVRHADAHTWPEALIDGVWVQFEPTPEAGFPQYGEDTLGRLRRVLDAAAFRWQRYVIAYSVRDQIGVLMRADDQFRTLRREGIGEGGRRVIRWTAYAAFGVFLVVALIRLFGSWRRPQRRKEAQAYEELSRRFKRLTRHLARVAGPRDPGETAAEWFERCAKRVPSARAPLAAWLELFHPLRYGNRPLTSEERATLDRLETAIIENARERHRALRKKAK